MDKYITDSDILDLLEIGNFDEIRFFEYNGDIIESVSKENFQLYRHIYLEHYKNQDIHSIKIVNNKLKITFFLQTFYEYFPAAYEVYNIN